MSEIKVYEIDELPGDGRGSIFFNREPSTEEMGGLELLEYEGYTDEDSDWDDFGDEFYYVRVKGTREQVEWFVNEHFYGEGDITEE